MIPEVWPVIATRGRPEWIRRQVDALRPQLKGRETIIVVVDGCAQTQEALKDCADSGLARNGVLVIALAENIGVYGARALGNSRVPADAIVCEIDDHDIAFPELLAELRTAFEDDSVGYAYCDVIHTDPNGAVRAERKKRDGLFREQGQLAWGMKAYRKWLYDAVGGYPQQFARAGDYALMCRIEALCGDNLKAAHIRKPLVTVIQDSAGLSGSAKEEQQRCVERISEEARNGRLRLPYEILSATWPNAASSRNDPPPAAPGTSRPNARHLEVAPPTRPAPAGKIGHRALLVTEYVGAGRGGGELSMMGYLAELHRRGWELTALYATDSGERVPVLPFPMKLRKAPEVRGLRGHTGEASAAFIRIVQELDPDVIITEAGTGANIADACKLAGIPLVAVIQFWRGLILCTPDAFGALNGDRELTKDMLDDRGVAGLRGAAGIVANSHFSAGVAERVLGRKPDAVCFPIIRKERAVGMAPTYAADRTHILCCSMQRLKGAETFLELARRNPDKSFEILLGDHSLDKNLDVARIARTIPNLAVCEAWADDMPERYARARVVLQGTATCESFSRVAAEAVGNGCVLLATDAGNLVNMVGAQRPAPGALSVGPRGVCVSRAANITVWQEALDKALAMEVQPSAEFLNEDAAPFADVVERCRNLSDVVFVKPNAPGINTGVAQFRRVLGCRSLDHDRGGEIPGAALTIVAGLPFKPHATRTRGMIASWWCSNLLQMDTARGDIARLCQTAEDVSRDGRAWLLCTHKPMADMWQKRIGRAAWLPNVYELPNAKAIPLTAGRSGIFLPGHYAPRKNPFVGLAACAIAGLDCHVTGAIRDAEGFLPLAERLGVRVVTHECNSAADVTAVARHCMAAVCMSSAETYCLAALDCLIAGTPVIAWPGIPVLACGELEAGVVMPQTNNDPIEIAALLTTMTDPERRNDFWQTQYAAVTKEVQARNRAARETLVRIINGEH